MFENIETILSALAAVILFATTWIERAKAADARIKAESSGQKATTIEKAAKLAVALAQSFSASVPRDQAQAKKWQIASIAEDAGCGDELQGIVNSVTKGDLPCVDAAGRIDGRRINQATATEIKAVDADGNRAEGIRVGKILPMVLLLVLLVAGCGDIPKAHVDADEAFMRRFDPEYREMIRKAATLNGGPVTPETIQSREDLIEAQWDEIRKLRAGAAK